MSYIEIIVGPLKTDKDGVEIPDSNKRGLKFNQYACIIVQDKIDQDHPGASTDTALLYAGLKGNCYAKGIEADFTFEDISDWVEELSQDVRLDVYTAYVSSTTWKKDNPNSDVPGKLKEIEDKKKELLTQKPTEENALLSDVVS